MCDHGHAHQHAEFGFFVDTPEVQLLIEAARSQMGRSVDATERIEALKPAFSKLLASDGWLPEALARPDEGSRMGDGIGQYALYRAEDGSLCLFSLVIPAGAQTPVHDHLAWGLIGVYRGTQQETVYRRLDDASDVGHATLEVTRQEQLARRKLLCADPADGRHSLRAHGLGCGVGVDPFAGERHGVCLATPVRSGVGRGDTVPLGLCECGVSINALMRPGRVESFGA